MNRHSIDPSVTLTLILFITIVALVNSTQNMISPNLLEISYYFGFGGATSQIGILTFTFTFLSGISMVIFGYLADKITRKWIVFLGTIIYSFFSFLTITVTEGINGYYLFFFLTAMNGIGFGAIIPTVFSLIGDLISRDDRSKGYSFFSIASILGMAIGIGLATILGSIDWRLSYLIIGILGFINAILIVRFKEPSRIGIDNLTLIDKSIYDYSYRIKKEDLKFIFKKKSNIWLIINFVDTIPTGIILFLLFAYMEDYHNIPSSLGLIFLIFILLSTLVGTVVFGQLGDKSFKKGNKKARANIALMANIAPIPFVFIGLLIPFSAPDDTSLIDLFMIPRAVLMLILFIIGMFLNGGVNGNWYSCVADVNLPEHRGTVQATANFFDIIGRALGPLLGAVITDAFGILYGMMVSILFWACLPLFWIPVMKNIIIEMEIVDKIFSDRLTELKK